MNDKAIYYLSIVALMLRNYGWNEDQAVKLLIADDKISTEDVKEALEYLRWAIDGHQEELPIDYLDYENSLELLETD